jgi:hypothetical protein
VSHDTDNKRSLDISNLYIDNAYAALYTGRTASHHKETKDET